MNGIQPFESCFKSGTYRLFGLRLGEELPEAEERARSQLPFLHDMHLITR
jgi:hypothetical protein